MCFNGGDCQRPVDLLSSFSTTALAASGQRCMMKLWANERDGQTRFPRSRLRCSMASSYVDNDCNSRYQKKKGE